MLDLFLVIIKDPHLDPQTTVCLGAFSRDSGVLCITFGAPLFGDEPARRFLTESQFAASMFHFVAERDPVPSLLSFAQSVSAAKFQLDNKIR